MLPLPNFADLQHLMVVDPDPAVVAALTHAALRVNDWTPHAASSGYGHTLVGEILLELLRLQPDCLVCPPPANRDPALRALGLACIEAARRHGTVACAWLESAQPGVASSASQGWVYHPPGALLECLLTQALTKLAGQELGFVVDRPAPMTPLVSVIVRSMDRPTLDMALASIALQTYRPIQLVLVNARGAEHSDVPFQGARLDVVMASSENGQPLARADAANVGLAMATAPLVLFLDDDDMLLPEHLGRLVTALQGQPDAAAAYSDVELGRHDAQGVWQVEHRFEADFDPVRLLFENYLPIHGVLFRHTDFWRQARFDTAFDLFEDWDFWLQLAALGPFVRVPGVSARYVAAGAGQSEVFADTPAARSTRQRLFEKWQTRMAPSLHVAAMGRLQTLHRQAASLGAELSLLRQGHAELQGVLQAREAEVSAGHQQADALRHSLAAREREAADGALQAQGLHLQVQARERELADALQGQQGLREVIRGRERELADALQGQEGLREVLAGRERDVANALDTLSHRDHEIADAQVQIADLRAVMLDKDRHIEALNDQVTLLSDQLAGLNTLLAQREHELAALHAEGPIKALARTLKGKTHASRP